MISYAFAQAVTPVTPPTDWTALLWIIGIIAVIVAGLVYYEKVYKPAHPTTNVVTALSADWTALVARVTALEGKVVAAVTPAPAPAPTPAGKNGVAGVLTIAVTGDPKIDLPAINAQYFS